MTMRITRLETKNVLDLRDGSLEFPPKVALVVGGNGAGKSNLHTLLMTMVGWANTSIASLVRRDAEGQIALDEQGLPVVPEAVLYLTVRGVNYRLTRRGALIKTERDDAGAWVACPGKPTEALARIVPPAAAPVDLLAGHLTDAGRIDLLQRVVPAVPFRAGDLLARAGVDGEGLEVDPDQHVLKYLDAVEAALGGRRLGVGQALATAKGVVETLALAIPAQAGDDPREPLQRVSEEGRVLAARVAAAERERDHAFEAACMEARAAWREANAKAQRDLETWASERRAEVEREIAERTKAVHEAAKGIEATRDQALKDADSAKALADSALVDERDALARLREEHAALRARVETWDRDAGVREQLEAARQKAAEQERRHAELTRQIRAIRALAASYIGAALPGVRVDVDETEPGKPAGKPYISVETKAGWQRWERANQAARNKIGRMWSELRQRQGGDDEPLTILDGSESLDAEARSEWMARDGQTILISVGLGPLHVENGSTSS